VKILHRIRLAIARVGRSAGPSLSGGGAGTKVGLGRIEAVERQEFPPEEFAADEDGESES
jgi:hypothetical protein